jgi:hypothetical protein
LCGREAGIKIQNVGDKNKFLKIMKLTKTNLYKKNNEINATTNMV